MQTELQLYKSRYPYYAISSENFTLIQGHSIGLISTNPIGKANTIARLYLPQLKFKLTLVKQLAEKSGKNTQHGNVLTCKTRDS